VNWGEHFLGTGDMDFVKNVRYYFRKRSYSRLIHRYCIICCVYL